MAERGGAGPRRGRRRPVVLVADAALPAVQALIRWDPVTHAERELAEREELRFPPAVRMAAVTGPPRRWPDSSPTPCCRRGAELLGPVAWPARTRSRR